MKQAEAAIKDLKVNYYVPSLNSFSSGFSKIKKAMKEEAKNQNLTNLNYEKFLAESIVITHISEWSVFSKMEVHNKPIKTPSQKQDFFAKCVNRSFYLFNQTCGLNYNQSLFQSEINYGNTNWGTSKQTTYPKRERNETTDRKCFKSTGSRRQPARNCKNIGVEQDKITVSDTETNDKDHENNLEIDSDFGIVFSSFVNCNLK